MKHPWQEIALSDYENHMKLDSVLQLQGMNAMMKDQLALGTGGAVMILGVAGGNGLEHIRKDRWRRVYGVDINAAYLRETARRHPELEGVLECLQVDLAQEAHRLPKVDLVIANLLVEYIGYGCFRQVIRQAEPETVSCIIQINTEDGWVSDSPYLHVFDGLETIHCQMEKSALTAAMAEIGYRRTAVLEHPLPNGKQLVRLDFQKNMG